MILKKLCQERPKDFPITFNHLLGFISTYLDKLGKFVDMSVLNELDGTWKQFCSISMNDQRTLSKSKLKSIFEINKNLKNVKN